MGDTALHLCVLTAWATLMQILSAPDACTVPYPGTASPWHSFLFHLRATTPPPALALLVALPTQAKGTVQLSMLDVDRA